MPEYQNVIISSAVQLSGTGPSTYHTLSGQANAVYLCGDSSVYGFYISFDSTKTSGATTDCAYIPPWTAVVLPVNHPSYITVIDTAAGGGAFDVSVMEYV